MKNIFVFTFLVALAAVTSATYNRPDPQSGHKPYKQAHPHTPSYGGGNVKKSSHSRGGSNTSHRSGTASYNRPRPNPEDRYSAPIYRPRPNTPTRPSHHRPDTASYNRPHPNPEDRYSASYRRPTPHQPYNRPRPNTPSRHSYNRPSRPQYLPNISIRPNPLPETRTSSHTSTGHKNGFKLPIISKIFGKGRDTSSRGKSHGTSTRGKGHGTSSHGRGHGTSTRGKDYGTSTRGRGHGTSSRGKGHHTSSRGRGHGTSDHGRGTSRRTSSGRPVFIRPRPERYNSPRTYDRPIINRYTPYYPIPIPEGTPVYVRDTPSGHRYSDNYQGQGYGPGGKPGHHGNSGGRSSNNSKGGRRSSNNGGRPGPYGNNGGNKPRTPTRNYNIPKHHKGAPTKKHGHRNNNGGFVAKDAY